MPPILDKEKCNACGVCADICPTDVFRATGRKKSRKLSTRRNAGTAMLVFWTGKQSAITLRIPLPAMMLHVEANDKMTG